MKLYMAGLLSLGIVAGAAEEPKEQGLKIFFNRQRRNSMPDIPVKSATVDPQKEFMCESARYHASPNARALFEKIIHYLKTQKPSAHRQEIELYEKAFNYMPHTDDPNLGEEERKRLCDLNRCMKLMLGGAHEQFEVLGQEEARRRNELELRFERDQMKMRMETMQIITEVHKQKNIEKEELVRQVLEQHRENTRLSYISMGVSGALAVTTVGASMWGWMRGR